MKYILNTCSNRRAEFAFISDAVLFAKLVIKSGECTLVEIATGKTLHFQADAFPDASPFGRL